MMTALLPKALLYDKGVGKSIIRITR